MKSARRIITAIIIIGALVIGFLLISDTIFNLDFGIIRESIVSESEAVLTSVRDVLSLNTVEVVHKVVFPYDFVPADMDWPLFLEQFAAGREMSPLEESYIDVYLLCEDIGIKIDPRSRDFVVITAIIKAGFDLSDSIALILDNPDDAAVDEMSVPSGIELDLPPAVITDFIIEDASTSTYVYPDITIGPEGWQKLTSFVREQTLAGDRTNEILELATGNGKRFIEAVLLDSGYSTVSFRE